MLTNSDLPDGISAPEADQFPDPEVAPKAKARSSAASYRKQILADLDKLDRLSMAKARRH